MDVSGLDIEKMAETAKEQYKAMIEGNPVIAGVVIVVVDEDSGTKLDFGFYTEGYESEDYENE